MPELIAEYPTGLRSIEMTLVSMLNEKRSWNDLKEIESALYNIREKAKSMQKEQKQGCAGSTKEAPND